MFFLASFKKKIIFLKLFMLLDSVDDKLKHSDVYIKPHMWMMNKRRRRKMILEAT